jgi:hypothetical protein
MKFSHTLATTATPEKIWHLWTDVEHWHIWDTELQSASLSGDFALRAQGKLKPKTGPESGFVISQLEPQRSYTFTTQLPFCKLNVRRYLMTNGDSDNNRTTFTHEVSFDGISAVVFGYLLGRQFQTVLPTVMENLRRLAEASP